MRVDYENSKFVSFKSRKTPTYTLEGWYKETVIGDEVVREFAPAYVNGISVFQLGYGIVDILCDEYLDVLDDEHKLTLSYLDGEIL